MRETAALKTLLKVSAITLILCLGVVGLIKNKEQLNFRSQNNSFAQTSSCSQTTLNTIGTITFSSVQSHYDAQIACLLP